MADPRILAEQAAGERGRIRAFIEEHGTEERARRITNQYPTPPARLGDPETEAYTVELMAGLMEIVEQLRHEIPKRRPRGRPRKENTAA
jgi:hypothetical protein